MPESNLTVAVTGPTGTFGFGLMPLLQADERIARVVGIARRPFDASEHGWTKMTYRRGDVRDVAALEEAFQDADVVVHLAFMITGAASRRTIRRINVEGTLNAFRGAAAAGARRFVYASSVAAYGFHRDNPVGMTEDWPARPAAHLFYAQEKA
jgi:nucleoside-diphosphate-sugar epimerase